MAYDASHHAVFSDRAKNWIIALDNLYTEAGKLDDIYSHEAGGGSDPAWVDTNNATAAEHIDAIVLMRRVRDALALDGQTDNVTSEDQTARMTPFLQ